MPGSALAWVVLAGLIHASWNIAAKKANGDVRFAFFIGACTVLFWFPVAFFLGMQPGVAWSPMAWLCVVASGLIHVAYFVVLFRGYRLADLTVVYPLARGFAPILSAAAALALFGENISIWGVLGIAGVAVGVFLIAGGPQVLHTLRHAQHKVRLQAGMVYGLLTGVTIATYTVVDAYAVKALLLSPVLMFYMSCVVQTFVLAPVVLRDPATARQHWRLQWKYALAVGVLSPVSYVMVLYAMQIAPLSLVAPAREVSMLFAALIGGRLLGEGDRMLRVLGALCIATGVVALSWG
jgi:drug/metabolite transporter (DMT)-like permease